MRSLALDPTTGDLALSSVGGGQRLALVEGADAVAQRLRRLLHVAHRHVHRRVALEGHAAREHLVEHDADRVEVGRRADLVELDDELRVRRVMRAGEWVADGAA